MGSTCGRKLGPFDCCSVVCADCVECLPRLPLMADYVVITDPPYGIAHPTNYLSRGRAKMAVCKDYAPVMGDNSPFDPGPILRLGIPTALWGGNHFASRLPDSAGWLVWDKERPDDLDQSTCELAWTNFVKGVRRFRFLWNGMIRASDDLIIHPTQKPVELMMWIMNLPWTPQGLVIDPYAGSGSTLVAAAKLKRHYIGFEAVWEYVSDAMEWLAEVEAQPNLFDPQPEQMSLCTPNPA
jgi:site-specific DNA-methyltransferase (adenine-specific)